MSDAVQSKDLVGGGGGGGLACFVFACICCLVGFFCVWVSFFPTSRVLSEPW